MDQKSKFLSVVLLSALVVSFESVAIEGALNTADLNLMLVSAFPSIIGGLLLMGISPRSTVQFTKDLKRQGWFAMTILCVLAATGTILWFDAIGRIGAGKEAILGGGSSEVLFVVILSAVFLSERLSKVEAIGGLMIVLGVMIVLVDAEDATLTLSIGEIEAIVSSFFLGMSIILATYLLKKHDLTPFSGLELLISGIMIIVVATVLGWIHWPNVQGMVILVVLGVFPAVGLLTYNAGLPKIGASLTSVLFALNGIMTVGVQGLVLLVEHDANVKLPDNVALALLGGAIAFIGVYLVNRRAAPEGPAVHR